MSAERDLRRPVRAARPRPPRGAPEARRSGRWTAPRACRLAGLGALLGQQGREARRPRGARRAPGRRSPRAGARGGRRGRGPARARRRATRARALRDSVQAGSRSGRAARSTARRRRVATRAWWSSSGSSPSRSAGIVGDGLTGLDGDHRPDVLERRRPPRRGRRLDREEPERPEQLRPPVALLPRRRASSDALQRRKRVRAAFEGLDLELDEAVAHAPPVENGDGVDRHVGHRRPFSRARTPSRRVRRTAAGSSVAAAEDADEEAGELVRRRPGPAGNLQLEALALAGELELPEAAPVLRRVGAA